MRVLIAMSGTRRPQFVTIPADDEAEAAALAWYDRGGSNWPTVRYDGKRWLVSDGMTTAFVTILSTEN